MATKTLALGINIAIIKKNEMNQAVLSQKGTYCMY